MPSTISLKLNKQEEDYLKNIAEKNSLYKNEDELSKGKAIKLLIKNAMSKDESTQIKSILDNQTKILEQIHSSIPQMLNHILLTSFCANTLVSDEIFIKNKLLINDNLYKICGQFQEVDYKHNHIAFDKKGMRTLPIQESKNIWKLN